MQNLELKNKLIKADEIAELIYKITYFALVLLSFNSFMASNPILTTISYGITVFGAALLLFRLVRFKSFIKMPNLIFLVLFIISLAVSTLINREFGIVENIKSMVWLTLQFGLLYACDMNKSREKYKKEMILFVSIFVAYVFVCDLISFGMFFSNYGYHYSASPFGTMIGFLWGRLWGVYTDPNYGSVFNAVSIVVCFCGAKALRNKGVKVFCGLNIVIDYLYIMLSDSRTGMVCSFIGTAICCGCLIFAWMNKNSKNKVILKSVLCVVLAAGISYSFLGVSQFAKRTYNEIAIKLSTSENPPISDEDDTAFEDENETDENDDNANEPPKTLGRDESDTEEDISNRRFDLWKSGVEIWKQTPIFGTAPRTIVQFAEKNIPDTYLVNNDRGAFNTTHNTFFDILASQGVVGFAIIIAFFIATAVILIKKLLAKKGSDIYVIMLVSILAILSSSCMFVLDLIYLNSAGAFLFWMCLGTLIHYLSTDSEDENA